MKKTATIIMFLVLFHSILEAQTSLSLPYSINFEVPNQISEWTQYEVNDIAPKPWLLRDAIQNDLTTFSNCIFASNDYVWSDQQAQIEWLVSPSLDFTAGGYISFRTKVASPNAFGALTYLQPSFYVGIYLLEGSNDPDTASSVTEIINFTNSFTGNDDVGYNIASWIALQNIEIPTTNNTSYIAFKYKVQDAALTFHVYVDDIQITPTALLSSNHANNSNANTIAVSPNPIGEFINFSGLNNTDSYLLTVYAITGQTILTKEIKGLEKVKLCAASGMYLYRLENVNTNQITSGKLLK